MATDTAKTTIRFPKRELNTWLKNNLSWNHEQWLELVSSLDDAGFQTWTSEQKGIDAIGLYLETKKKNAQSFSNFHFPKSTITNITI